MAETAMPPLSDTLSRGVRDAPAQFTSHWRLPNARITVTMCGYPPRCIMLRGTWASIHCELRGNHRKAERIRRGGFMRANWKLVCGSILVGVAGFLVLAASVVGADKRAAPTVLPNGWKITPAGRAVALPGDMPLRVLPLP